MTDIKLTRREWDALGSLLLPPKLGGKTTLGPKMAAKLQALGLVEPAEWKIYGIGSSPIDCIPITIKGWRLTMRGNIRYCEWASEQVSDEELDS
jgi:hypothetical protein